MLRISTSTLWRRLPKRLIHRLCYLSQPQKMWKRYIAGLLLIFGLVGGTHIASLFAISAAEDDVALVNESGRQRMLSQRILFLEDEIIAHNDISTRAHLRSAINIFAISNKKLSDAAQAHPEIAAHYNGTDDNQGLYAQSAEFAQVATNILSSDATVMQRAEAEMRVHAFSSILQELDHAVTLFDQTAQRNKKLIENVQLIALVCAAFILLGEAIFIFVPAQLSVNRAIQQLARRRDQLQRSFSEARRQNTELRDTRAELARAAYEDHLTGLPNRNAFNVWKKPDGSDAPTGLLQLDIAHFRSINESFGSDQGDRLLRGVADLLCQMCPDASLIARLGSDEFAVIVHPSPAATSLDLMGRRIIADLTRICTKGVGNRPISLCVGYTCSEDTGAPLSELHRQSSLALFHAKEIGVNIVRGHNADLEAETNDREDLRKDLERAIEAGELVPWFQPQVAAKSGALCGSELLARWDHPERGIIPPGIFLPLAAESGLLQTLDRQIRDQGLDHLVTMRRDGLYLPNVSMNVPPATLVLPGLVAEMCDAVESRGLQPEDLILEILESTLIESGEAARIAVEELSAAGFKIIFDDFGAGYASLSHLALLPLHGIKLDRSLISPLPAQRSETVISAITTLAHSLNMEVLAEGVETDTQELSVTMLNCDYIQGYGIAKPMPLADFVDWLVGREGDAALRAAG